MKPEGSNPGSDITVNCDAERVQFRGQLTGLASELAALFGSSELTSHTNNISQKNIPETKTTPTGLEPYVFTIQGGYTTYSAKS